MRQESCLVLRCGHLGGIPADLGNTDCVIGNLFFPLPTQKFIVNRFNLYEIKQDDLKEWCDRQTIWEKGIMEDDVRGVNVIDEKGQTEWTDTVRPTAKKTNNNCHQPTGATCKEV